MEGVGQVEIVANGLTKNNTINIVKKVVFSFKDSQMGELEGDMLHFRSFRSKSTVAGWFLMIFKGEKVDSTIRKFEYKDQEIRELKEKIHELDDEIKVSREVLAKKI